MRIPIAQGTNVQLQVAVVLLEIPFLVGLEFLFHYGLNLDFYTM